MEFFTNVPLIAGILGWFIAEIIKMFIKSLRAKSLKEIHFTDFFASGGMPSSHAASMCALSASIGYIHGLNSPIFAVAVIMTSIVMYDASGVRRETGEQAKALNMIMRDMFSGNPEYSNNAFKELIGHTKSQVFVGAALGILIGIFYPMIVL